MTEENEDERIIVKLSHRGIQIYNKDTKFYPISNIDYNCRNTDFIWFLKGLYEHDGNIAWCRCKKCNRTGHWRFTDCPVCAGPIEFRHWYHQFATGILIILDEQSFQGMATAIDSVYAYNRNCSDKEKIKPKSGYSGYHWHSKGLEKEIKWAKEHYIEIRLSGSNELF